MIDEQKGQEIFSISAGEKTTKAFVYTLPSNLPKGEFVFRVQLATSRGEEMGWIDKVISIGGEGRFLKLDNCWIVKDGQDLSPGGGVDYQPGEIPQVHFDVTNDTNFTITAFPKIITYKRNVGEEIVKIQQEKDILLKPGQKKTIESNLPPQEEPESYLSEVRLYLKDTLEPVSNSIYFRWIVSGESAKILSVSPDKESYQTGEEAEIRVQFTGPAHAHLETEESEPKKGELEVKLYNERDEIIGERKKEIELDTTEILVNVPIKEDVDNPRIEAKITKDDKVLDQYQFQTIPTEKEEVAEKTTEGITEEAEEAGFFEKNKKLIISILAIALIVIIIISFLKVKKRKSLKSLILLCLISLGFSFAGASVLAATEVVQDHCDTTIVFNTPQPNQTYNPGDTVHFSGRFRVTSCGDGLFHNKIEFFITADRDIPVLTRNCCSDCCGGTSVAYGGCVQNLRWCNEVKIVDPNQPDVYKLGTIYPADVHAGARPYWVEYNQYFTIPSGLEFEGPVRFYVQYSGTHWKSHWHWNITYQSTSKGDYCSAVSAHYFSWTYSDLDGDNEDKFRFQVNDGPLSECDADPSLCEVDRIVDVDLDCSPPSPPCVIDNDQSVSVVVEPDRDKLVYGTNYHWRVKVWDVNGNDSGWVCYGGDCPGKTFSTEEHRYPMSDFTWFPTKIHMEEEINFQDQSICYDASNNPTPCSSWVWTIPDADYLNDTNRYSQNPFVKFKSLGEKTVKLEVSDGKYSCPVSKDIKIKVPFPSWEEVSP